MKNILKLAFITILAMTINFSYAQVSTNLKAQFYAGNITHLHLPNIKTEYHVTNSELLTFAIDVKTNTRKYHVFDFLVAEGRYNLQIKMSKNKLYVIMPNLRRQIMINKQAFEDDITIKVYIPKKIKISKRRDNVEELLAAYTVAPVVIH